MTVFSTESLDVSCEFRFENWAVIERVYDCKVIHINIISPSQTIEKVHGVHHAKKSDKSVMALNIFGQSCHYFPDGIHDVFGNLEGLLIAYCGLKSISSSDLKPFTLLQVLFLPNNDIVVLEKDLFKFNYRLKAVVLSNNRIKHIAFEILTPMKQLTKIFLYKNHCIDNWAVNPNQIQDLVTEMIERCPPEVKKLPKVKSEIMMKFDEVDLKISKLQNEMRSKYEALNQQLELLETLLLSFNKKLDQLSPLMTTDVPYETSTSS